MFKILFILSIFFQENNPFGGSDGVPFSAPVGKEIKIKPAKEKSIHYIKQVVYWGIKNKVVLPDKYKNLKNITLKASQGKISKPDSSGNYIWEICDSISDKVYLDIYSKNKCIGKLDYEFKKIESLTPHDGRFGNLIEDSWTYFSHHKELITLPEDGNRLFKFIPEIKILEFFYYYKYDSLKTEAVCGKNIGATFCPKLQECLKNIKGETQLVFTYFIVQVGCEPKSRDLGIKNSMAYHFPSFLH